MPKWFRFFAWSGLLCMVLSSCTGATSLKVIPSDFQITSADTCAQNVQGFEPLKSVARYQLWQSDFEQDGSQTIAISYYEEPCIVSITYGSNEPVRAVYIFQLATLISDYQFVKLDGQIFKRVAVASRLERKTIRDQMAQCGAESKKADCRGTTNAWILENTLHLDIRTTSEAIVAFDIIENNVYFDGKKVN